MKEITLPILQQLNILRKQKRRDFTSYGVPLKSLFVAFRRSLK
jgi:hypothetical protein